MTIADKLTYLGETKDLLADAINGYTQVISPDTPFREYAQWIDNIVFSAEGGIASLFDEGESGFAWSSLPYYQDPAGTTEAVWGNPVGLIGDDTDNGVEFTQATVTARPILGRVPVGGRRNLLRNSGVYVDSFPSGSQGAWSTSGDGNTYEFTTGTQFSYGSYAVSPGKSYNFTQDVALVTATVVGYAVYDETHGSFIIDSTAYTEVNTDFSRKHITFTTPLGCTSVRVYPVRYLQGSLGTAKYRHPQLEEGTVATPYQHVTSQYDITESGVESTYYLHFDGTDDSVSTTLPAITNGTVVVAGTNGIWIDDDFNHVGGAFNIGPTSYTNGPSGILDIVGDLIVGGSFVIDRQLTAEERARVINKLKSMGAPGVFELGPELVVNGDFSDGTAGWETYYPAGIDTCVFSTDGGRLKIDKIASGWGGVAVNVPPWEMADYLIENTYNRGTVSGPAVMTINRDGASSGNNVNGRNRHIIRPLSLPTGSVLGLALRNASLGTTCYLDNVSARKLELIP